MQARVMTTETIPTLSVLKNLGYIPAIFIGLSVESYAILAALMIVDTLFGVMRTWVVHGGRSIKSYKLTAGILSKLTIIAVPLLTVWAGRGAGIDLLIVAQAVLGILVLAEFYSIVASIHSIRVRRDVHEFDAVSWILRRLQALIERTIKSESRMNPPENNEREGRVDYREKVAYKEKDNEQQ